MRIMPVLALLVLLLAGCSSQTTNTTTGSVSSVVHAMNATAPKVHVPVAHAVNLTTDGMLARTAGGCVFAPVQQCEFQNMGGDKSSFYLEGKGNLTSLTITVEWKATTPVTDTLALAVGLFPCQGCSSSKTTFLGGAQGGSPLTLTIPGATPPVQLNATNRLHFFVYNSKGTVYNDQVPGYGYASDEQAFKLTAIANLLD